MDLATNPFVFLSYVGGPAILTNASSLLLMSTSNRFARAVDRSRYLIARMSPPPADLAGNLEYLELFEVRRRVRMIASALTSLYLAAAMFGLATLLSIVGAVMSELRIAPVLDSAIVAAAVAGFIGFSGLVSAGIILVFESRLAMKSLVRESDKTLGILEAAIKSLPPLI